MSAREAYIAGRSGGRRPPDTSTKVEKEQGFGNREQAAYDAGRQERQRAEILADPKRGITSLSQRDQEQAKNIAKTTKKDPYNTLTREEQIDAGYPKTDIEKLQETTGTKIISPTIQLMAGAGRGIKALLDKVFKPSVEDFNDPVVLAAINRLFEKKKKELGEEGGEQFKKNYLKDYADKMKEAFDPQLQQFEDEQGFGLTGDATGIASLFDDKLADAAAAAQSGALGKGVQRINFPEEFYLDDGEKGIMPQTIGGLEDLAGLDVNQFTSGPGYNQNMVDMIFDARAELDRQQGGQGGQGGGAGIPSLPQFQDKMDITKPGYTGDPKNPFGLPGDYGSGFIGSQFYKPGTSGLAVMTPVKLPDGTTHMFPDSSSANQFQQYLDHLAMNKMGPSTGIPQAVETSTGIPSLTPTTINYASMAPQFGSQYPGYINQGVMNPNIFPYYDNLRKYYGVG